MPAPCGRPVVSLCCTRRRAAPSVPTPTLGHESTTVAVASAGLWTARRLRSALTTGSALATWVATVRVPRGTFFGEWARWLHDGRAGSGGVDCCPRVTWTRAPRRNARRPHAETPGTLGVSGVLRSATARAPADRPVAPPEPGASLGRRLQRRRRTGRRRGRLGAAERRTPKPKGFGAS
jgi:hypothetical protein